VAEAARQKAASDPSAIEARIRELEQGIKRDYHDERDQEDAERVDPEVIFGPGNIIRQLFRAGEALVGGPARNDPRVAEIRRLREQLKKLK
jgi:hypothetical protein